jgi:hypothetical protein
MDVKGSRSVSGRAWNSRRRVYVTWVIVAALSGAIPAAAASGTSAGDNLPAGSAPARTTEASVPDSLFEQRHENQGRGGPALVSRPDPAREQKLDNVG